MKFNPYTRQHLIEYLSWSVLIYTFGYRFGMPKGTLPPPWLVILNALSFTTWMTFAFFRRPEKSTKKDQP